MLKITCKICGRRVGIDKDGDVYHDEFVPAKYPHHRAQAIAEEVKKQKSITRDAGFSVLETMLFLTVFAAIVTALVTFASTSRQIFENFQIIERCLSALLECKL